MTQRASDCVQWWQHVNPQGYGELGKQRWGKTMLAHRFIWEECFRPLEPDETLHHLCGNRACVNPEHLHLCRTAVERTAFRRAQGQEFKAPPRVALPINLTEEQAARFWTRVDKGGDGCWEWRGRASRNGYGSYETLGGPTYYAHRVAYTLGVGPIPDGLYVCHRCDNPRCCNPAHLFAATAAENTQDMVDKGRSTPRKADYGEIVRMRRDGYTQAEIARRLGVSAPTVARVLKGAAA